MDLEQFVHGELFVPVVLVIATERVKEQLAVANDLAVADLFAPFGGYYTPITAQCRVIDKSTRLHGFKVRFVDANAASNRDAEEEGLAAFRDCSPSTAQQRQTGFLKWFGGFNGGLGWSGFDCLDQPIATVLVVSSSESNAIDAFEQLSHVTNQPGYCRSGLLDPTSARVKVLLHDSTTSLDAAESLVNQLRTIYTPNSVILLPINSGSPTQVVPEIQSLFSRHATRGRSLSWEDVDRMNSVGEQIVCQNAVPWLERKLQGLDANITAKRRGLRNQLRNFLKSGESQGPSGSSQLSLQQVEWQCRLAGDIAFHLRAYDHALSFYRNVCSDFKQDKALALAAAGCYEMSGLSGLMAAQGTGSAELARFLDTALELYRDGGAAGHAVRAAVLQSMVLKGKHEAAEKLIKANGEIVSGSAGGVLRSAILLDQAAYLHGVAGMRRKAAFTRVLAGHMFNKVEGCKEWALDAYSSVIDVYGSDWGYIRDHLLFTMAKLEFGLGRLAESKRVLIALLTGVVSADPKRPPGTVDKHTNYVKLLTYVAKAESATDAVASAVPLPLVRIAPRPSESVVAVELTNPLLIPIEVSELRLGLTSGESEVSGLIQLDPGETRVVCLETIDASVPPEVTKVLWTLNGCLKCLHDVYI